MGSESVETPQGSGYLPALRSIPFERSRPAVSGWVVTEVGAALHGFAELDEGLIDHAGLVRRDPELVAEHGRPRIELYR